MDLVSTVVDEYAGNVDADHQDEVGHNLQNKANKTASAFDTDQNGAATYMFDQNTCGRHRVFGHDPQL